MTGTDKLLASVLTPLDAKLSVASLVVLEGPPQWRGRRIRLDARHPMGPEVPARGMMTIGAGSTDLPIDGLEPFDMIENIDGDFVSTAQAKYSAGATYGAVLPHYATIDVAPFLFIYVPPTPDGLGIPPDYALLTVPKAHPTNEPALLVKAGYQRVIGRKFLLLTDKITIGGALSADVPLFRMRAAVVARLVRGIGELNYFAEAVEPGVGVTVAGAQGDRKILTPYASIVIGDWELSLLPPSKRPS